MCDLRHCSWSTTCICDIRHNICVISPSVDDVRYEVAKAEVEMGKYQLVEDDLWRREEAFQLQQTDVADLRHKREVRYKNMAEKMKKSAELWVREIHCIGRYKVLVSKTNNLQNIW